MWLSVPFGIIIALICFSGAMLVFEDEIEEVAYRNIFFVNKTGQKPLPADILIEKAEAALPDGVRVTGLTVFSDPDRCYRADVSKPRRGAVYIDQYTGRVTGHYERLPFFKAMFGLHRWLLDTRPSDGGIFWGKLIVGVSTLLFTVILITGVIIWWPRTAKNLRRKLAVKVSAGWYRFWYGLHTAGGIYATAVLLILALTGLTWSFNWYRDGFYRLFGAETARQPQKHGDGPKQSSGAGSHDPGRGDAAGAEKGRTASFAYAQRILDRMRNDNPGFGRISVSEGTASVYSGETGNSRAADRYYFNTENGEPTGSALYADTERAAKLRGWIYSVHVGSWGGSVTKTIVFLAALLGAALPLTGYYLWIKRLLRKRRRAVYRTDKG